VIRSVTLVVLSLIIMGLGGCGGPSEPPRTVEPTESPSASAEMPRGEAVKAPRAIATH
jgi:hypothetical protein